LSRTQLDEFSVGSHERAAAAQDEGRFDGQIAPLTLPDGTLVAADEGVRRGSSMETLANLKTVFKPDGGTITGATPRRFPTAPRRC
jgi:acetyl-CoA acyltransferase